MHMTMGGLYIYMHFETHLVSLEGCPHVDIIHRKKENYLEWTNIQVFLTAVEWLCFSKNMKHNVAMVATISTVWLDFGACT